MSHFSLGKGEAYFATFYSDCPTTGVGDLTISHIIILQPSIKMTVFNDIFKNILEVCSPINI